MRIANSLPVIIAIKAAEKGRAEKKVTPRSLIKAGRSSCENSDGINEILKKHLV
jgi:hypothetical protein